MKEYFKLQFTMTNRKFKDAGILPVFAYPLLIAGFIWTSYYLFEKLEYAEYFYPFLAVYFVLKFSDEKRNDFLKTWFRRRRI